jgi:hypothetical protein
MFQVLSTDTFVLILIKLNHYIIYMEDMDMAIKSNLDKHTVSWLKSQDDRGLLNKNISIQRKEVWDSERKSNLVISLLLDIPIESLLFEEAVIEELNHDELSSTSKKMSKKAESIEAYNVLDGKQRTLTLCAFLDDGFALSPKIRVKEIDGVELVGLRYSQLPENMQEKITEYELSISVLRPLDAEDRATVFFMRNQAVSLSKMDLSLVMLGEEAMTALDSLCNHDFMMQKIKLTEPARRKHMDLQMILQYLILRIRPEIGFSGTEIMNFCDDIKNGEVSLPVEDTAELLNYLDESLPEKRQYLKKVHIPAVMYAARKAMGSEIEPGEFGKKLDTFFEDIDARSDYVATYESGSSKRTNVQTRVRLLCEGVGLE